MVSIKYVGNCFKRFTALQHQSWKKNVLLVNGTQACTQQRLPLPSVAKGHFPERSGAKCGCFSSDGRGVLVARAAVAGEANAAVLRGKLHDLANAHHLRRTSRSARCVRQKNNVKDAYCTTHGQKKTQ